MHPLTHWLRSRETRLDARAIASALGLFFFFIALKVHLAWWFLVVEEAHPDIRLWQVPLLFGGDIAVCAGAAVLYFLLRLAGSVFPALAIPFGRMAPLGIHAAIVLFSVVSWQVSLIYTTPLSIDLLRAADDLGAMRDSITDCIGVVPVAFLTAGLLGYFALQWPLSRFLVKVPALAVRWRLWGLFLASAAVLSLLWIFCCRGAFDYGLKRNAILHFIQYYSSIPEPVDRKPLLRELTAALKGMDSEIRNAPSLIAPALAQPSALSAAGRKAAGMNVLLILMESTSAQYVDRETTPNIFRLADTGVLFSQYFTTVTKTDQALYSILFSDYLPNLGLSLRQLYRRPLPQPSLATVLGQAGYKTAVFYSGDLNFSDTRYLVDSFNKKMGATRITGGKWKWSWGAYEEQTVASLSRWLTESKTDRFFALYSTVFPHHPYFTPDGTLPFGSDTMINKYRNSLQYADRCIGTLIDFLEKEGLREQTLIVLIGDHGETVSSRFRFGHGIALTPEEVVVPCVVSNPQLFKRPAVSGIQANHLDISPTILGLLNLPSPGDWLGRNLAAASVPARQLYVNIEQTKVLGVIDGNVVYSYDEKSGLKKFQEWTSKEMIAFSGNGNLSDDFQARLTLTDRWATWRHLDRALSPSRAE